ncbi:MAG: tRNA uridine-5-carboxymethylaminomethyl(34) synthesis GTPase MnmE [Rikenellaceae bacterium]|nr:tRNA uridine-5-carboxymethylaminomethyl(34) synthesis GTPase MnmE [Rikenellaceae bacterium]
MLDKTKTISAVATGEGGAIAVIRVSGKDSVSAVEAIFQSVNNKKLTDQKGFTVHYGYIRNADNQIVDDVLVTLFKSPNSYTGEDIVEISCHASPYIKNEILKLLGGNGVEAAAPGEFTLRAFLNGKLDLSQAEAVADIIASENKASHNIAVNQIRGGYSEEISRLRERLIELLSLLELELDFSEEDVEFADRGKLNALIVEIYDKISALRDSFSLGNILKNGIPIAIVGNPNAGKSTLLNSLLNEDKALVSDIPGTTRDVIEDSVNINGIKCRFIDTAGIRETKDVLENMGIERTYESISKASVILLVCETGDTIDDIRSVIESIGNREDQKLIVVVNKSDKKNRSVINRDKNSELDKYPVVEISAKYGDNIQELKNIIFETVGLNNISNDTVIVSNSRHYNSLSEAKASIERVVEGLKTNIPPDLLAQDIRACLHYLSEITGNITSEDVLQSIFSNFCIGK